MKNNHLPLHFIFCLGMILILSACSPFSSSSLEEQTTLPESTATAPPPATEERIGPEAGEPREPNPASIDVSLEEGAAAAATIGPEGGSITTMDAKGTGYTLKIPEGALFSEVEITMTPIASAEGESIGDTFLAGVALQPENLHFIELVSIEITGDVIEEDVLGFSSERGGQDFHLTPSKFASGSLTITTSHFSEFGVSLQEVVNLVETLAPVAETAILEHNLVIGDDQQALSTLERRIRSLRNAGQIASFEEWEPWTANVMSLLLRLNEVTRSRGWNENTPGLTDVLNEMQSLVDQWFEQSDGVLQDLVEQCVQGEIEVIPRVKLIRHVGRWLVRLFSLEREEVLKNWDELLGICFEWGMTWQANVVTTGSDFFSDISVGSEVHYSDGSTFEKQETLEVEYVDGFFEGICEVTPGVVSLALKILWIGSTEYYSADRSITSITAYVRIDDPVYIDCSPAGFDISADAQKPFHGGALETLNADRVGRDGWEFDLEYDPGGGVIAQFEEGPKNLTWSEGEYKLWQLLTLYQSTPVE